MIRTARQRPTTQTPTVATKGDASSMGQLMRLIFLTLGIYATFIVWGVFQEKIGTQMYVNEELNRVDMFNAPHVLMLSQCVFSLLFSMPSCVEILRGNIDLWKKSKSTVLAIGFAMSVGAPLSYLAMGYIPYPFVVTVKMGKLVPIVIMGILVFKEKYSGVKKLVALIITVGVLAFTFATPSKKRGTEDSFHGIAEASLGVSLVILNLIVDGVHNSAQDSLKHVHGLGGGQLQAISNLSCLGWLVAILTVVEFIPDSVPFSKQSSFAADFFIVHPDALWDVTILGFLNAVGQLFIFSMIASFDTITVTTVNVTRKVFSVVASVFVHNHNLSLGQWISLSIVLFGVGLETKENISKQKKKSR